MSYRLLPKAWGRGADKRTMSERHEKIQRLLRTLGAVNLRRGIRIPALFTPGAMLTAKYFGSPFLDSK
jgi:hypothetical protein